MVGLKKLNKGVCPKEIVPGKGSRPRGKKKSAGGRALTWGEKNKRNVEKKRTK